MNIDLRNVSEKFETAIEEVKKNNDYKTNIKAVEHCVLSHSQNLEQIEKLKAELYQTKQQLSTIKGKLNLFVEFSEFVKKIK
ncbi:hypothetical protein D3C85_322560 [compost metagenome]